MKIKGYHFEHNFKHDYYQHYDHDRQPLASLSAGLTILAFSVHTMLEWMDDPYQRLRRQLFSPQRWCSNICTLTSYLRFEGWVALMTFMPPSFEPSPRNQKQDTFTKMRIAALLDLASNFGFKLINW